MSRYTGRGYDGDRRSRSPSPYRDRGDRGSQYGDGDRRRQSVETRANNAAFQSNRDAFRDPLTGREPPRGPKALLDPPSGPRGGGFAGDLRGRGRGGGGRGRTWRDDSRDRGRDRESDYRDRPHFRDERSRERERDWRDRDRDGFAPRGRRLSPQGRGRSPPGRDFRDTRDVPLNVDAERARRGSRDGPLSAGSSNSDPPFGPQSFRGGGFPRGGRGRGRGDWDRGGRGRPFFDEPNHRYGGQRSRSQEGRWGRDPDERDRRDLRYNDSARDARDDREQRDRPERDLIPRKFDRVSHEPPPSTKDVSPPPLAPSAPAFGSVPSRQPSGADIQSLTGKAPPTGPRALTEERPVSAGHSIGGDRPPHAAPPLKPSLPDGSPPIPVGPRAQQQKQPHRTSKQWINPTLAGKKVPDSPKLGRSQSFVSQQPRPFSNYRPESSHSDQHPEPERRPRSPDAQSEPQAATSEGHPRGLNISGPNDVAVKSERSPQSTGASIDVEPRAEYEREDTKMADVDAEAEQSKKEPEQPLAQNPSPVTATKGSEALRRRPSGLSVAAGPAKRRRVVKNGIPAGLVRLPARQVAMSPGYQSSESDDDEDMDAYFQDKIAEVERDLEELGYDPDGYPVQAAWEYFGAKNEAIFRMLKGPTLSTLIGPLPDGFSFPCAKPKSTPEVTEPTPATPPPPPPPVPAVEGRPASPTRESSAIPTVEKEDDYANQPAELQPKVEEIDTEGLGSLPLPSVEEPKGQDEDVHMQDVDEAQEAPEPMDVSVNDVPPEENGLAIFPSLEQGISGANTPSAADLESDDRTEDDVSMYGSTEVVREYSATPPTDDLPVYNVKPWYKSKTFRKSAEQAEGFESFLVGQLEAQTAAKVSEQEGLKEEYSKKYEGYLRFTLSDDIAAVKSRDYFALKPKDASANGKTSGEKESKAEGSRRTARFSTELDLHMALQESLKMQQEKQEREERAQKEKYRTDKEAVIPPMFWTEEDKEKGLFYDTAGLLPTEKLVPAWQVVPWHVNFTEEEAEKFEKAYLESPKQWGKIAKDLPNRDFGTCIQYYYAKKRELNLKEKLRKQPKKRKKGRGKQRSSALVSELGNAENEVEEQQDNGDGAERSRRPRRAAAPTWGFEQTTANVDSDGATPAATPGRRRAGTVAEREARTANDSGAEKAEPKRPGRKARQPKADKEAKLPKPAPQNLAPTPQPGAGAAAAAAPSGQAKSNRSRSNSRATGTGTMQGPEWLSPQTPADLGPRPPPPQFEGTPVPGMHMQQMQPPMGPVQHQGLTSPERVAPPPMQQTISDMMAPPQLRPEPIPPQASVPTFDIGQLSGSERVRSASQASSYWSVAEANEFPALLRSFGTDWSGIAGHMGSKTAVMVKNYYMRQKDMAKNPDWEPIAKEADAKAARGEKRPAPPVLAPGPRKKYDSAPGGHRTLAAAESEDRDRPLTKAERGSTPQPFSRFPVPIAQASPVPHSIAPPPPASSVMSPPVPLPTVVPLPLLPSQPLPPQQQQQQPQQQPPPLAPSSSQPPLQHQAPQPLRRQSPPPPPIVPSQGVPQTMSPNIHPRVAAHPTPFSYGLDRESEPIPQPPVSQPQHPGRIPQKPVPIPVTGPPVTEAGRPGWVSEAEAPISMPPQQPKRAPEQREREREREPRDRQPRMEAPQPPPQQRDPGPIKFVESRHGLGRLKQEQEQHPVHHQEFQQYQPPQQRVPRNEPISLARQPEPPRAVAPTPRPYTPPVQVQSQQPMRPMMSEHASMQHGHPQMSSVVERPMSAMQRPMPSSMQEQYPPVPAAVHAPPPPPPPPPSAPPRQVEPRKTSNLMALLNDDPPAPTPAPAAPKRVNEVSGIKPNPTPPPSTASQMPARAPPAPSMASQQRREVESPGYPYAPRSAGAQSAMPSLKPSHPQSPQPQHLQGPRSSHVSPMDSPASAVDARPEYYRHHHFPQHQASASNSPSQQVHHYPGPSQHEQRMPQQHVQHSQQSPMAYQPPTNYAPYPASQPHAAASPTPQFAPHPSMSTRRDPIPSNRESWQQAQQQPGSASHQQQQAQPPPHQQHAQSQPSWAHQSQPKPNPPPATTAWGAQHGAQHSVQPKPPITSSMAAQQHSWPSGGPPSQQHALNLRDTRAQSVYGGHESHSPGGLVQHGHHRSMGSTGYPGPDPRRPEPGPPPVTQPPYARYTSTPGPGQVRDHPARSYTPVSSFDPRGPPPSGPPPYSQQEASIIREAQMREAQHQLRETHQMREMGAGRDPREMAGRDPRDPRELAAARELAAREQQQQMNARELAAREQQMNAREREIREMQAREQQQQHPMSSILQRQLRPGPQQHDNPYDRGPPPEQRGYR
ncbi:hypothetical protein V8F33_010080 [Rhypophila sp. PSN 637]